MAVASEPYIFWNGDIEEAKAIISEIHIPKEVGTLEPAEEKFNGPSAKVLENKILKPLGVQRADTWLCDLLPESRINKNQKKAIEERYNPLIKEYGLNPVTVPYERGEFCNKVRRLEITRELEVSKAKKLVILGDEPIKQYLKYVADIDFKNLKEYTEKYGYGKPYETIINKMSIDIIPIAHPRQIGELGRSNRSWLEEHKKWGLNSINN